MTPFPCEQNQLDLGELEVFLRYAAKPEQVISRDVETNVKFWIAEIDRKLSAQLNEVMHHPDFQRLEATWRGLHYLVMHSETDEHLKLRVLNVSKRDLSVDLQQAVEFDQSALFKKVDEREYGQCGREPYGLLVGDYEFSVRDVDVYTLKLISNVAAVLHAPFVAAASPRMFGINHFDELSRLRDLSKIFNGVEYASWKSFRESEDSRYVALTLPHVLARLPYGENFKKVDEFNFEEFVDGKDHDKYLWMNAAWAYAARVTAAYAKYAWMVRTRGVEGGKVEELPMMVFPTDDQTPAQRTLAAEVAIDERCEFELSKLGFLPLVHCKGRPFALFMGAQSCQKVKHYFDPAAMAHAELAAQLNSILCVSRFVHALRNIARNGLRAGMELDACARCLHEWVSNYLWGCHYRHHFTEGTEEQKARYPLTEAYVQVREARCLAGRYEIVGFLTPHYQFDQPPTRAFHFVAEFALGSLSERGE
jgi:type VI secretion system protein ImpC